MEAQQTPLRTAIMRIMSDMLDNPDENGIFETGRFMDRTEQLLCDMMGVKEVMQLSGSEAVMGFLAWLTTRDEMTVLGPTSDGADAVALYQRFVDTNGLSEPREAWSELLTHPAESDPEPVREKTKAESDDVAAEGESFDLSLNGLIRILADIFPPCDDPECEVCIERKNDLADAGCGDSGCSICSESPTDPAIDEKVPEGVCGGGGLPADPPDTTEVGFAPEVPGPGWVESEITDTVGNVSSSMRIKIVGGPELTGQDAVDYINKAIIGRFLNRE